MEFLMIPMERHAMSYHILYVLVLFIFSFFDLDVH